MRTILEWPEMVPPSASTSAVIFIVHGMQCCFAVIATGNARLIGDNKTLLKPAFDNAAMDLILPDRGCHSSTDLT